jgi:hypothetical protein
MSGTGILSAVTLVCFAAAPAKPAKSPYVVLDTFEKWEWTPITHSMMKSGRKVIACGDKLPYEYRGPLYRRAKGFVLPTGRMVEGKNAYKGRSMLLDASGPKAHIQVGLHGRYSSLVKPRTAYAYEVVLRGKGTFHFRAWVHGKAPYSGKTRWLGFPNLIKVKVTKGWQVYRGTFTLPTFDESTYKIGSTVSAAIVVEPGNAIYVDDFRVREASSGISF